MKTLFISAVIAWGLFTPQTHPQQFFSRYAGLPEGHLSIGAPFYRALASFPSGTGVICTRSTIFMPAHVDTAKSM